MKFMKRAVGLLTVCAVAVSAFSISTITSEAGASKKNNLSTIRKFAPQLYLHKREQYFPGDVEDWFSATEMRYKLNDEGDFYPFKNQEVNNNTILNFEYNENAKSFSDDNFYLYQLEKGAEFGDNGANNNGVISAPIFGEYTYGTEYDTITYHLFYPRDGGYLNANLPDEAHQGDWERIEVYVDRNTGELHSVLLNAFTNKEKYYSANQLQFDGTHPKIAVAAYNHTNYLFGKGEVTDNDDLRVEHPSFTGGEAFVDYTSIYGYLWNTWGNVKILKEQEWSDFAGRWGDYETRNSRVPQTPRKNNSASIDRVTNQINFYSQQNGLRDMLVPLNITGNLIYNLGGNGPAGIKGIENNSINSLKLNRVEAGTVIKLFDDENGSTDNDYVEIYVKEDLEGSVLINRFDQFINTRNYQVIPHIVDGIVDGVSRIESETNNFVNTPSSFITINAGEQAVSTIEAVTPRLVSFANRPYTDNKGTSLTVHSPRGNTLLTVFDDPQGGIEGDYTQIYIKKSSGEDLVIEDLDTYYNDENVIVVPHYVNGLEGNISSIIVETNIPYFIPDTSLLFKDEEFGLGNDVGVVNIDKGSGVVRFAEQSLRDNAARSVIIRQGRAGDFIRLGDGPNAGVEQSYTEIYIKKDFDSYTMKSFDSYINNEYILAVPSNDKNIGGKVSGLYYDFTNNAPTAPISKIDFFGEKGLRGNVIGSLGISDQALDIDLRQSNSTIPDDQIASMGLRHVVPGTIITVYTEADPASSKQQPYTVITVREFLPTLDLYTLNPNYQDANSKIVHYNGGSVDGNISRITVTPSYEGEYVKIRNVANNMYLEVNTTYSEKLYYTPNSGHDAAYWKIIRLPHSDQVLIQNKLTGGLVNLETIFSQDSAIVRNVGRNYLSGRWILDYTDGDSFKIRSDWWRPKKYLGVNISLNVLNYAGYAEATEIPDSSLYSSWKIER